MENMTEDKYIYDINAEDLIDVWKGDLAVPFPSPVSTSSVLFISRTNA